MIRHSLVLVAVLLGSVIPAWADDRYYYPNVSGRPSGVAEGVLINYGRGMKSGNVTIRTSENQEKSFYAAAAPFTIDGKIVDCPIPPRPGFVPSKDVCATWPAYVKIGTTRVRVFYWHGRRYGKPTLVTNKLVVVR